MVDFAEVWEGGEMMMRKEMMRSGVIFFRLRVDGGLVLFGDLIGGM